VAENVWNKLRKEKPKVVFVLYGREAWFLTLREGHGMRVVGNRMARNLFVLKWDEVRGGWKDGEMRSLLFCVPRRMLLE
jgi:hypothetical protein